MKKLITLLFVFLTFQYAIAQEQKERKQHITFEILGPSGGLGLAWTHKFKAESPFEYRLGLSWGYAKNQFLLGDNNSERHYMLSPGINYVIGKKKSHLELGAGLNMGLINIHNKEYVIIGEKEVPNPFNPEEKIPEYTYDINSSSKNTFGYFIFTNIAYRYVAKRGFTLKVGLTPTFNFGDEHGLGKSADLLPYLAIGYSF